MNCKFFRTLCLHLHDACPSMKKTEAIRLDTQLHIDRFDKLLHLPTSVERRGRTKIHRVLFYQILHAILCAISSHCPVSCAMPPKHTRNQQGVVSSMVRRREEGEVRVVRTDLLQPGGRCPVELG